MIRVAHCHDDVTYDQAFDAAVEAGCRYFYWRNARYEARRPTARLKPGIVRFITEEGIR